MTTTADTAYDFTTQQEVAEYVRQHRNWGRWGADDEVGAVNLITPEKRIRAASMVRTGQLISLSLPYPKDPSTINPKPAVHYMERKIWSSEAGFSIDYLGLSYHGRACTHLDALCHVWEDDGMWNGRDPNVEIGFDGAHFGDVDKWGDGIVTRGVLLDVPKFRGEPYVTLDKPVMGSELVAIAESQGVTMEPGDALVVYSGRERHDQDGANAPWGGVERPGLHASCLRFLRENDTSMLLWDMLDLKPHGIGEPWNLHAALWAFGVGLVDNVTLGALAQACAEQGRYEFQLMLAPLRVQGGTGCPINPLALL